VVEGLLSRPDQGRERSTSATIAAHPAAKVPTMIAVTIDRRRIIAAQPPVQLLLLRLAP
jgi:hypothetical protein